LNWIDLIMAIVLGSFAVRGFMKGFFRELLALVGVFFGLWVALLQFVPLGEWLQRRLPLAEPVPYHAAFLALFFGVSLVASAIGWLLQKAARVLLIGWVDALLGLGFGLVKGVMIATVLLFLIGHLPLSELFTSQLRASTIVGHLELINPFVERSVQAYARVGGERLRERLRVPVPNRPPVVGEEGTVGEAFRR
jgi:membrane protein required for colicin V production